MHWTQKSLLAGMTRCLTLHRCHLVSLSLNYQPNSSLYHQSTGRHSRELIRLPIHSASSFMRLIIANNLLGVTCNDSVTTNNVKVYASVTAASYHTKPNKHTRKHGQEREKEQKIEHIHFSANFKKSKWRAAVVWAAPGGTIQLKKVTLLSTIWQAAWKCPGLSHTHTRNHTHTFNSSGSLKKFFFKN